MRGCDDRHGAFNNRSTYFWKPYDQSIPDREKIVNIYYYYYYYYYKKQGISHSRKFFHANTYLILNSQKFFREICSKNRQTWRFLSNISLFYQIFSFFLTRKFLPLKNVFCCYCQEAKMRDNTRRPNKFEEHLISTLREKIFREDIFTKRNFHFQV